MNSYFIRRNEQRDMFLNEHASVYILPNDSQYSGRRSSTFAMRRGPWPFRWDVGR